jgi:hypothetical protein
MRLIAAVSNHVGGLTPLGWAGNGSAPVAVRIMNSVTARRSVGPIQGHLRGSEGRDDGETFG